MRCTSPRTVGFHSDGKTLCWSYKNISKEFATFQLPCGKCLSCRLEYARQWAVRCVHEASMYEDNSFVTLTYSDDNLKSDKLIYADFQEFQKKLRTMRHQDMLNKIFPTLCQKDQRKLFNKFPKERRNELFEPYRISIFVTGEYGDQTKRPHWHALIFNWRPTDATPKSINDHGDQLYTSQILEKLWPHGRSDLGQITFESAGYVARYAAKKLGHGKDQDHDYHPISKKSSRYAIGKKFLEKFHKDIFNYGKVTLLSGKDCSVPRYYEKWLQKHHKDEYRLYLERVKLNQLENAAMKQAQKDQAYKIENDNRPAFHDPVITENEMRSKILKQKFKQQLHKPKF